MHIQNELLPGNSHCCIETSLLLSHGGGGVNVITKLFPDRMEPPKCQNICMLEYYKNCCDSKKPLSVVGPARRKSLKYASEQRGDSLHLMFDLEEHAHDHVSERTDLYVHKNCASSYTSKHHLKRYLAHYSQQSEGSVVKRSRRSAIDLFHFKEHCLICGEACSTTPDPKNPSRWKRVVLCRTADRGSDQKDFKDVIFNACDLRNDDWALNVHLRLEGAVSDLHAADAQYHKDCMSLFRGSRNMMTQHHMVIHSKFWSKRRLKIVHFCGTPLNSIH
jgi:hypothetical protein